MDKIKVFALGGLDEEGKDLYCIEINEKIFVINAGYKHPTKFTPGIDFIIADFTYLKENKERIAAYIVPKNKAKHFGALPYIYRECPAPIYCTEITKTFFEIFAKEYEQMQDFDFRIVNLPSKIEIAGYEFTIFATCSSAPSSFGFSISTDLGNIVFSGDYIIEYNNSKEFYFDLNTVGKIAEKPTLLLMCDSTNANKKGYCSPHNKLTPYLEQFFKKANGRIFIAFANDNFYHMEEIFRLCNEYNKKICFYDDVVYNLYLLSCNLRGTMETFSKQSIINREDVLRVKEKDLVILMSDEKEELYEKVSLFVNNEHEFKLLHINHNDTFIMACPPSDSNEVIFTSTIDELYKAGCAVKYLTSKDLDKMHGYEEDIRMLLSLLKPKYYFPVEGYYVNLLSNAKIAFDMNINLSHNNIFLLDNGHAICIDENGAKLDFNNENKIAIGDVMIDGIGVGDVVNEIINDRNRLGTDGVIVLGCGVSKKERKIAYGPDVQMRGFLFLKDKDADALLKEISELFVSAVEQWLQTTEDFNDEIVSNIVKDAANKYIYKQLNRNPAIKPCVVIVD